MYEVEGPNDVLVSVKSAHWGEYLGTMDADHIEVINLHLPRLPAIFSDLRWYLSSKLKDSQQKRVDFEFAKLYGHMVNNLKAKGH